MLGDLQSFCIQGFLYRTLANRGLFGKSHAIRRQHAGQRMSQHLTHRQRIGHQTGMLSACAAKYGQGVAGDVISALYRNLLDRIGHVCHSNVDEALRQLLGTQHTPGGL